MKVHAGPFAALTLILALGCGESVPGPPDLSAPPDLAQLSPGIQRQHQELRHRWTRAQEQGNPAEIAEAWGNLGHWHALYRYPDSAEHCYTRARELMPSDPRWPYFLAIQAMGDGRVELARRHFETVLELAPESLPARVRLAELEQVERPEVAAELFRQALEQDPSCGRAHYGLGKMALEAGDPAAAITHLEAALAAAPANPGSHYLLGLAFGRQGETARAEHHLSQVPDDSREWSRIALQDPWNQQRGRLDLSTRSRRRQAERAAARGETRRAVQILSLATAADPENPSLRLRYALALSEAGRIGQARAQMQETLRRSPGYPTAHFRLGLLLARQGELEASASHLRAAVKADPELAQAQLFLGHLLLGEGKAEEALPRYAGLRQRFAEAAFWHGLVLIWLDRQDEAAQSIDEDRVQWPEDRRLRRLQARLLAASPRAELRDGARALELARIANGSNTMMADAVTLAMALAEVGRFDRASSIQRAVVAAARETEIRSLLHRARRRLALYERQRPCRNPWERGESPRVIETLRVEIPER